MLKSDRRGVSVIIGYIILVSMGIGLSVVVFNWLIHYVPEAGSDDLLCPDGVSVMLRSISCVSSETTLSFDVRNNGLFRIDGFMVKVNDNALSRLGIYTIEFMGSALAPQESMQFSYDYADHVAGFVEPIFESNLRLVEVTPYVLRDGEPVYCSSVRETLRCNVVSEFCFGGLDEDLDGLIDCEDPDCAFVGVCSYTDPSIVTHLTFDTVNDSLHDSGSFGHDAILVGSGASFVATGGYDGRGAYVFSGSDGGLELVNDTLMDVLADDFSVSLLIKPEIGGDSHARILSRDCDVFWCLLLEQDAAFPNQEYRMYSDPTRHQENTGAFALTNDWYHLVLVFDAASDVFTLYVNGEQSFASTFDSSLWTTDNRSLALGTAVDAAVIPDGTDSFIGTIDDVKLYDYSLDIVEVSDLYAYYGV